jgi:D-alanyl-D-alanine endopeptidase (penicillin-binding protein 7)
MKLFKIFLAVIFMTASFSWSMPITAKSWVVAKDDGTKISSKNDNRVMPIASITKLMTVMVVLDAKQKPNDYIKPFYRSELIMLALVNSNNAAAESLCRTYPGGYRKCIDDMNLKAKSLGLTHTKFYDPTGLNRKNVSTAEELIAIVLEAFKYEEIVQASKINKLTLKSDRRWVTYKNTNPDAGINNNILLSKTGFTNPAGGCIVMMMKTDIGRRVVVVLGSKNTHTRIPEAEYLAQI